MKQLLKQEKYRNLSKIILINTIIFTITNLLFNIKYEQVDDFIMYNLYSGLDGTYSTYGVYMHTILCAIIGLFYRIVPAINWHTIFLLSMQFICFTIIGYCITEKQKSEKSFILYAVFASVFYSVLLVLIQYTSVAALLILTALFIIMHLMEREQKSNTLKVLCFVLYTVGIMLRMQSLLIIAPFFALYAIYYLVKYFKKQMDINKLKTVIADYAIIAVITIAVYISHNAIYENNPVYKEYMEYNNIRAILHDMSYTDYEENKQIFDEIGWSKNDHYLFYTFNFGDENVYSKENLQKIIDYKISTNQYYNLNSKPKEVREDLVNEMQSTNTIVTLFMFAMFFVAVLESKDKKRIKYTNIASNLRN